LKKFIYGVKFHKALRLVIFQAFTGPLNLQERIRNAQVIGDVRMMAQLQREIMQFTKQIMLKQC
jgi:hypothetical protein